jgi:hypothetical protein
MEREGFLCLEREDGTVSLIVNVAHIEAVFPGTARYAGKIPEQAKGQAILQLASGSELVIDRPINEVFRLIVGTTKREIEV